MTDRAAMDAALEIWPDMAFGARANRPLLGRAVRHLVVNAGIRQFLDIGTGIPTAGNTHEVAQAVAPESRVVYVDYDRCKSGCSHAHVRWPRSRVGCGPANLCTSCRLLRTRHWPQNVDCGRP